MFFNSQKLVRVRFSVVLAVLWALSTSVCGQSGFILPLKQAVYLTGNYGEVRPNHFHAGLDFKTDPKVHLPIYAVADGYVSRIKVSTHGYGKVVYITHPNGKVSVYGHQFRFNDSIRKYVMAAQDMLETFEVELFPRVNELRVKQGELIGYSGNTGDSEGPHLHFELRDEKSETPLNPQRFLPISDTVAPEIVSVEVYDDDYAVPNILKVNKKLLKTDTLLVGTKFGLGIECYDLEQRPGNKNNVYAMELWLDRVVYHKQVLDSIAFDLARYVNTYSDYTLKREKKMIVQKCFVGKNNDLPIYKGSNAGFFYLEDTLFHTLEVKVYDIAGHSAARAFIVKRRPATRLAPLVNYPVHCLQEWKVDKTDYSLLLPAKSLYKDVTIIDSFNNGRLYFYGKDYNIPLHKNCIISIRPPDSLLSLGDKLCLVDVNGNYYGGELRNERVMANTRNFGIYKVSYDTTAPKIKMIKQKSKKKKIYRTGDVISFSVSDNLSGIGPFKVFINDRFQLAEYEHKTGQIFFEVSEGTPKGSVQVRLELMDRKGNKSVSQVLLTIE